MNATVERHPEALYVTATQPLQVAPADTFVSVVGLFPMSVITPTMAKWIGRADDDGCVPYCTRQTERKLAEYGLAKQRGFGVYLTLAGWRVWERLTERADRQLEGRWTGTGTHRTRTIEWKTGERYKTKSNGSCGRYVPTTMTKAECLCGWSEYAEDRANSRWRARHHRETAI